MARVDLQRIAKARRSCAKAKAELRASILAAVASGETYADVGRYAGLSKARIQQIVAEDRKERGII